MKVKGPLPLTLLIWNILQLFKHTKHIQVMIIIILLLPQPSPTLRIYLDIYEISTPPRLPQDRLQNCILTILKFTWEKEKRPKKDIHSRETWVWGGEGKEIEDTIASAKFILSNCLAKFIFIEKNSIWSQRFV